ncbi:MAG: phosphoglycerate kinase [Candidatus Tectomicrobia bacterium]|nr:phosphoglycerate kinase [Candidatus Tectomicrobia bacterium]
MQYRKRGIDSLDLAGKRVFVRADLNVPLDAEGRITDDTRLRAELPTLRALRQARARIILASHLGRPKGRRAPSFSLRPVAAYLREALGCPVAFADDCVGPEAERAAAALRKGDLLLLENLRFHAEEEANDPRFARQLAALAEVYVNDAFGTAHRAHASTEGIAKHLRPALAGPLMQRELEYVTRAFVEPKRPVVALLGGAKVSDKLGLLRNLLSRVDSLLIGGAMAFTFLAARGVGVGRSLVEPEKLAEARALLDLAAHQGIAILLPEDVAVTEQPSIPASQRTIVAVAAIPAEAAALDIGPATCRLFAGVLRDAGTIIWNGPLGKFETPPFDHGTLDIARAVAASPALSIAGGGDTASAIHQAGVAERISFISTGGGAFLELLEGLELPGVAALDDA